MPRVIQTDVIVVGSGIAGLLFALKVSRFARVAVVTKKSILEANTNYAQGGIAAVLDPRDSLQAHLKDTLRTGAGLCDEAIARKIIWDAPRLIAELESLGVPFTRKNKAASPPSTIHHPPSSYDLGLEGGHSARRIVHATDFTGRALETTLAERVKRSRRIEVFEEMQALDLILSRDPALIRAEANRAVGVQALDAEGRQKEFRARVVVLASGGAGKVYLYTTNPEIATGDGMAMAYRAGLPMANLEFVQFHPTCLYHPSLRNFLISEAVRGEGAKLVTLRGEAFMRRYHPMGELAPRDIVARAIDAELKKSGDEFVYLDITRRSEAYLRKRFPNIFKRLAAIGLNMAQHRIPVVPAAHYFCGGVLVQDAGRTEMPGLYAIGEVACNNFHGANRLASNSLLEACAFADYASRAVEKDLEREPVWLSPRAHTATRWGENSIAGSDLNALIAHNWDEVRRLMTNYVGIVRSRERLYRARRRLELIQSEINDLSRQFAPAHDLAELVNIIQVARMIVDSALKRPESRGLHYMADFSKTRQAYAQSTVIQRHGR